MAALRDELGFGTGGGSKAFKLAQLSEIQVPLPLPLPLPHPYP